MATYYAVLAHKGPGQLGGLFTNLSDAQAFVSSTPKWATDIIAVVLDDQVGASMNTIMASGPISRSTMAHPGSIVQGVSP